MDLWRLTKYRSLKGEGGTLYAARWNSVGGPIVYLASSPGSALAEVLIHLELAEDEMPSDYFYLRITAPDTFEIPLLHKPTTEPWKLDLALTRKLGDAWLKSKRSALARVPSAILPATFNYLLNPLHPDANRIKIAGSQQAFLAPRLLHKHPKP